MRAPKIFRNSARASASDIRLAHWHASRTKPEIGSLFLIKPSKGLCFGWHAGRSERDGKTKNYN